MSEPTPVFDPPVLENGTSAVEADGNAPPASTTDNGGAKDNNVQDVTMAGVEDSGVKAVKPGDNAASWQNHFWCQTDHLLPTSTTLRPLNRHRQDMMASPNSTSSSLNCAKPSPTASYRSPRNPGLVHLTVPSNRLAQLSLASNNATTTTAASTSTNPPTPNRTSTPTGSKENVPARLDNNTSSSRAASAAPADRTADRVTMPTEPAAHGAPTRQYLNSKVTYHVMEGMKVVAKEQPADPLRVLGEFLLKRSAELERATTDGTPAAASAPEGDKEKKENGADTTTEQ